MDNIKTNDPYANLQLWRRYSDELVIHNDLAPNSEYDMSLDENGIESLFRWLIENYYDVTMNRLSKSERERFASHI